MKLTKAQADFLRKVADRPASWREGLASAVHHLWARSLIDKHGASFHITEAGRAALKEMGE